MNRRDFLRLRPTRRERVLDLSCRDLYLEYIGARAARPEHATQAQSADEFFAELWRELADVRTLHIVDRDSVTDGDFRRRFGDLVSALRAVGGTVEMRAP